MDREGLREGEEKGGRITHSHEQIEQTYEMSKRRKRPRVDLKERKRNGIVIEVGDEKEKTKQLRMELSDLQ